MSEFDKILSIYYQFQAKGGETNHVAATLTVAWVGECISRQISGLLETLIDINIAIRQG